MTKMKIYVTHLIPEKGLKMLEEKGYDLIINSKEDFAIDKNINGIAADIDILLTLLTDKIDENTINALPKLKLISNYAVGYNNIDINAATAKGVYVTNTPRTLDSTTADFVMALILSVARRIVESDKYMRSGKYKGWEPMDFLGHDVHGSTLGIVGMGNIGKEVAKRAHLGFDMNIIFCDPDTDHNSFSFKTEKCDLEKLLRKSDFVSLNVPLTQDTFHLIGDNELSMMKSSAYLINTSRGPVIDEKALLSALQQKKIAGAALDVYENEPDFEPGLEKMDNVIMTSHIASASGKTRDLMSEKAARNIIDFVEGRIPEGLVNKDVIKKYHKAV